MIMLGTSLRRPGLPGRLGLFAAAAVLLPIGASWAQKPDAKEGEKLVVISPEGVDFFTDVEVKTTVDPAVSDGPEDGAKVVLRVQGNLGDGVELSGSIDEVMKKIEGLMADLKKDGASKPGAKAQADALMKALQALKGAKGVPNSLRARHDAKAGEVHEPLEVVVVRKVQQARSAPPAEKAAQVAKAREEVARLRKELDATLDQLKKAQARLQELGEDAGDSPVVRWQRSRTAQGTEFQKVYTVVRPKTAENVRYTVTRPIKPATSTSDQDRLNLLEKQLKDLQLEFERLKKGSPSSGEKR